jgi:positive regulator of sigma E activity
LLEAGNDVGAAVGDAVRVAVSAGAVVRASALIYLLPIAGLLAGAGLAQVTASLLYSPETAGNAAGFGGIAGAAGAALLARRLGNRPGVGKAARPRITTVLRDDASLTKECPDH